MIKSQTEFDRVQFSNFNEQFAHSFRFSRNSLIEKRLECVKQRQIKIKKDGLECYENLIDYFAKEFEEAKTEKICLECGASNDFTYRKCTNCGGKVEKNVVNIRCFASEQQFDPYLHFDVPFVKNNTTVKVGEPDAFNPNSFVNISVILRNLGKRAGIKKYDSNGTRFWIFVEVDGGIYVTLKKLIENVVMCKECQESFYGKDCFDVHVCCELQSPDFEWEFDWVVPIPGQLHLEMNAAKAFMSFNWSIFLERVMQELGITSKIGLKYAKKRQ